MDQTLFDEERLGSFPNSFSETTPTSWFWISEELPAVSQLGGTCGTGCVAADTAAGPGLPMALQLAGASHPLIL